MATIEAMQILECIKDTPGWLQMRDAMKREKKATWQQILAFHTSPCCQPHKAPGLVESVEEAGLPYPFTDPGSGKIAMRLIIPKLFIVEFDWDYTSAWHDSHAQAKEAACFDTLCTFLMLAPHLVRLNPNSLMRGSDSVSALRAMGNNVPVIDTTAACYKADFATLPAVPEIVADPKGSPNPGASAPGTASSRAASEPATKSYYAAPAAAAAAAPAAPASPYEQVEALLRHWYQGKGWKHPSRLQAPVRQQLNNLLQKGMLKRTLQARPDKFQIWDIPKTKQWEFLLLE